MGRPRALLGACFPPEFPKGAAAACGEGARPETATWNRATTSCAAPWCMAAPCVGIAAPRLPQRIYPPQFSPPYACAQTSLLRVLRSAGRAPLTVQPRRCATAPLCVQPSPRTPAPLILTLHPAPPRCASAPPRSLRARAPPGWCLPSHDDAVVGSRVRRTLTPGPLTAAHTLSPRLPPPASRCGMRTSAAAATMARPSG